MGFRVRRSIKLAPGIRLNLSKTGVGLSAGVRGARVSVNSRGRVTKTVGLPGTGVSYSTSHKLGSAPQTRTHSSATAAQSTAVAQHAAAAAGNPTVKMKGEFLIFIGALIALSAFGSTKPSDAVAPLGVGALIAFIGYVRMVPWLQHRREVKYRALPKVQYQDALSTWQARVDALSSVRTALAHAVEGTPTDTLPEGVILKKNEVSLHQSHGFLRRAQDDAPTDEGLLTLTSDRIIFTGPAKAVEWSLAKLTAAVPNDTACEMGLWVSNRSTVHYVSIANADWPGFLFRFNWALDFQRERNDLPALWARFDQTLAALEAEKPKAPSQA